MYIFKEKWQKCTFLMNFIIFQAFICIYMHIYLYAYIFSYNPDSGDTRNTIHPSFVTKTTSFFCYINTSCWFSLVKQLFWIRIFSNVFYYTVWFFGWILRDKNLVIFPYIFLYSVLYLVLCFNLWLIHVHSCSVLFK